MSGYAYYCTYPTILRRSWRGAVVIEEGELRVISVNCKLSFGFAQGIFSAKNND